MTDSTSDKIKHVVVMMFENRSFDNMLGFLYHDSGNKSPLGHPFEGLTGNETNPDSQGKPILVWKIEDLPEDEKKYTYYIPRKDPGEGFANTNFQLFGTADGSQAPGIAANQGFVRNFWNQVDNAPLEHEEEQALDPASDEPEKKNEFQGKSSSSYHHSEPDKNASHEYKNESYRHWYKKPPPPDSDSLKVVPIFPGTKPADIMGVYTPELLPVLSGLAKHYAVCDHWYSSAPTETLPNRAFTHTGTSQGYLYDENKTYTARSIYTDLTENGCTWGVFGNNGKPYTLTTFDIPKTPPEGCAGGSFEDFKSALNNKTLPDYIFLEPVWGSSGNSQHPNYNVAAGEVYLLEIYDALRNSSYWEETLLIVTYDEHGGCYDHVTPPVNAVSPPAESKAFNFDFTRFGVRVPAVLISPWIAAGTVHRADGDTPFDHTSILATVAKCFGLPKPLTDRQAAAPDLTGVLTLSSARTDNPMQGVVAPVAEAGVSQPDHASQIQLLHAHAITEVHNRETGEAKAVPKFSSEGEAEDYISTLQSRHYRY